MSRFIDDTRSTKTAEGRHETSINDRWAINGNPNGGYLMAIMARALAEETDAGPASILTANFLSRALPGPAEILIEPMARSSQYQRYQLRLLQEGSERVRCLATLRSGGAECAEVRYEAGPAPLAARSHCVPVPRIPNFSLFERIELRMDPSCASWFGGELSEKSENRGWIRVEEGLRWDLPSLLLLADSMPPAVLASHGMVAWVPTLELSANIRALPRSEWLNCSLRTRFVTCGMLEADGELWDEEGNLVAISRQVAHLRIAAR